jgi:hypothetical protein
VLCGSVSSLVRISSDVDATVVNILNISLLEVYQAALSTIQALCTHSCYGARSACTVFLYSECTSAVHYALGF